MLLRSINGPKAASCLCFDKLNMIVRCQAEPFEVVIQDGNLRLVAQHIKVDAQEAQPVFMTCLTWCAFIAPTVKQSKYFSCTPEVLLTPVSYFLMMFITHLYYIAGGSFAVVYLKIQLQTLPSCC